MQDELRSTVAQFLGVDVGAVTPAMPLSGPRLQGSLGRAMLDAAIRRRVGVHAPAAHSARTYGELEAAVLGTAQPAVGADVGMSRRAPAAAPVPAGMMAMNGIRCGIDIEAIAILPHTNDPWADAFYQEHFSGAEIAYCAMQPEPRVHFAGRWCAKEALIKCDASLAGEALNTLEVVPHETGPKLRRLGPDGPRELPHALSISHTGEIAAAVVILHHSTAPAPAAPATGVFAPAPPAKTALWPLALTLAALLLSLAALVISLRPR